MNEITQPNLTPQRAKEVETKIYIELLKKLFVIVVAAVLAINLTPEWESFFKGLLLFALFFIVTQACIIKYISYQIYKSFESKK